MKKHAAIKPRYRQIVNRVQVLLIRTFPKSGPPRQGRQAIISRLAGLLFRADAQERYAPMKVERALRRSGVTDVQIEHPSGRASFKRAIYLAAIGVATIGWLWLIAWIALQLV